MNTQISQEASDWLIHFRTGTPDAESKRKLDAWLRRSPEHVRAYLEVTALWDDIPNHDHEKKISATEHIARARAESNVLSLGEPGEHLSEESIPNTKPANQTRTLLRHIAPTVRTMAASIVVAALAAGTWLYTQKGIYATSIGEQRSITLPDGSLIDLNSHTRIRVNYAQSRREVDLIQGQALFHVAKERARPFIVSAGSTDVRAVGTQFDVYRRANGTTVTVLEGSVAIVPKEHAVGPNEPAPEDEPRPVAKANSAGTASKPHRELLVTANEQVVVSGTGAVAATAHPDLNATTAWTRHRLVFNFAPLSEVVTEFNRYNTRQLVIESPELRSFAVVGVFSSTDPMSLIRFLSAQPDLLVRQTDTQIRICKK